RRQHRAGHDAHAFPFTQLSTERLPCQRGADFLQGFVEVGKSHRIAVHRRVVVRGDVDRRHDLLRQYSSQRLPDRQRFRICYGRNAGAHRLARLVDMQRIGVVAVEAAHRLLQAHARPSSSRVLMLRKASASSSKTTSTTLSEAYQASIFLPPPARNASRFFFTDVLTSANTGWGWSPVLATARSFSAIEFIRRETRSSGRNGESQGTVTASGWATAPSPACRPARGPAKPEISSLTTRWPKAR